MIGVAGHVLLFAIIATASPLALTTTLVAIRSDRPRTNGIAFLAGFVLGTLAACVLGFFVGQAAVARLDSHSTVEDWLTLLVGVALVVAGLWERHAPPRPGAERGGRSSSILADLSRLGPVAAAAMAGLLGFGGPKRLVLTLLAMALVTGAGLAAAEELALVIFYVAVATALVSVPVCLVLVAGERASVILARGESWLTAHAVEVRVWLALGSGAVLTADGLLRLLG
ncbi:MAG: hypothetical protein EXQ81_01615 [Thermoleophilia bacterium]|nr:hypothetical protein [Thermoleophilia bacterium]